ncbi:murein biosynthesis integral membrane protein MurJ [Pseudogemmobacter sonorensis]|uniref:murein biosynthesis integral membrane protein MurJ n=1 Tax=Pseudogemmobacter sonorensis TaxID=2989681 RepID=UPI00368D8FEF
MKPIRLVAGFLTVGVWTLLSRVVGFVRDVLIAAWLGAGPVAEAYYVAQSLPNMFRRFFAEGAFGLAFIPMFSKKLEAQQDAEGFARDAYWFMAAFLTAFTVIGHLAMPWLVLAMAWGFRGDERFELAVVLGRIAFPYILFISLTALISGVLSAMGRFRANAMAPVLMNGFMVLALIAAERMGWDMGRTLAWSVMLSGVLQLVFVWAILRSSGFQLAFRRPRLTPELRRLFIIAAPAVLAGGVVQINLLVGRQVASFTDGAIAWLYNADRLYQLPLGVVGIAVGVVLLPDLSRRLGAGDTSGGRASLNRSAEFALFLTVPAAVALVVIALPIVSVLFERGAFTAEDSRQTALALAVYALGLPAFVLHKVLQPLFYAREDTRRPFNYALVSMAVNVVFAFGLMPLIGFLAAAAGTTISSWVMVWQLWRGSRGMGEAVRLDARFRRRLPRILVSAALMGLVLWGIWAAFGERALAQGTRSLALLAMISGGMAVYFAAAALTGAMQPSEIRAAMRRGKRKPPKAPTGTPGD